MELTRTRRIVDAEGADAVLAAAEKRALEQGARVVIAVVDPHGELIVLRHRLSTAVGLVIQDA